MAKHRRPDDSDPGLTTPAARAAAPPPWTTGSSPASTASQRRPPPAPAATAALVSHGLEISQLAAELQGAAVSLKGIVAGARMRQYEARSDDGGVTVTVDGGGHVAAVRIGEYAIRSGPERIAASLTTAVNRALEAMRLGTTESVLDAASPQSRALLRGAIGAASDPAGGAAREEAGARSVTARSGDGSVTATASGLGTITSVTVRPAAVRMGGDGPARLGTSAAEAVNAVLTQAGSLRAQRHTAGPASAPADPKAAGAAVLAMFSSKMDGLLGTLDQLDRDLDQLAGEAVADLSRLADRLADGGTGGPAGS